MGLLDGVKQVLGDVAAATEQTIAEIGGRDIPLGFAKFYPGGLAGFLDRLRQDGHGGAVDSWLAGTDPRPVAPGAIEAALPAPVAERLANDLGVRPERLSTALAEFLPAAVTGASENGRLKEQPVFSSTQVVDRAG